MSSKEIIIRYDEYSSTEDLPQDEQLLLEYANMARKNAYAPYSHFTVGAAVKTTKDHIFLGSNQETANYKGSCAERTALDTAGTAGEKISLQK